MQFFDWAAVEIEQQDRWQWLYEGFERRRRLGLTNESIHSPGPRARLAAVLVQLALGLDQHAGARLAAEPGPRPA